MDSAEWFNKLEAVLEREADHAGLLQHGTMIGNVREFITQRVFQSFLPPITHYGSGKVVDAAGSDSRQVDLILFDGRFPRFSAHGITGLYTAEGVLATVEIKSNLSKGHLADAFENCVSVSSLQRGMGFRQSQEFVEQQYRQKGLNVDDAYERRIREALIPTYVFSFRGPTSPITMAKSIQAWSSNRVKHDNPLKTPFLPRIIVAGNLVALLNDGVINIDAPGPVGTKVLYGIAKTRHRFGCLATHLLSSICDRLDTSEYPAKKFVIDRYLSFASYAEEIMKSKNVAFAHISLDCCRPVGER